MARSTLAPCSTMDIKGALDEMTVRGKVKVKRGRVTDRRFTRYFSASLSEAHGWGRLSVLSKRCWGTAT